MVIISNLLFYNHLSISFYAYSKIRYLILIISNGTPGVVIEEIQCVVLGVILLDMKQICWDEFCNFKYK